LLGVKKNILISLLKNYKMNMLITKSSPVVINNETVTEISDQICMTKSANKHKDLNASPASS
jgi:hypothetical protein